VMRIFLDNANYNINKVTFSNGGNVALTGVSVSPTSATIAPGATQQLTATVAPSNATNKNVSWSSSNTSVATVNASGLVTGVANGTATITVTTQDGAKTATSAITVSSTDPAGVITCYKAPAAMTVNGQLTETGWNVTRSISKGVVGTPNNTATFGVMWDNTYLYIGAKVLDANLFSDSPNSWEDDAVEIYIDANNNKLTTYDGLDNQIIKNYNKTTVVTKLAISGLQHGWAAISGGYSVEVAIPWSALGITPSGTTQIGFDIGYDDDDNGGTREHQAVWNGTVNNYQNTSAFGTLRLNTANSSGRLSGGYEANAETSSVQYWPTEVTEDLHITCDGSFDKVEIVDLVGRSYVSENITGKKEVLLNVSSLTGGMHIVRMKGEKNHAFRIVKK
jgi:hypothetical protein